MDSEHSITINGHKHILYNSEILSEEELLKKSKAFYEWLNKRRSVRDFSNQPISKEVIENIIKSASTAPSGANKQPWTFCAISNPELKSKIRQAAELEEKKNYESRMSTRWKKDLEHLGTDMNKAFIEDAPWILVVFKKSYELNENGEKENNYYVNESVGIACGLFISAIHNAGLITLTHTPSPMDFLTKILKRPSNERPYLLLPIGYPKQPSFVPNIYRKELNAISEFYE